MAKISGFDSVSANRFLWSTWLGYVMKCQNTSNFGNGALVMCEGMKSLYGIDVCDGILRK